MPEIFDFISSPLFLEVISYIICAGLGGSAYALKARPFIKAAKFLIDKVDQATLDEGNIKVKKLKK